MARPRKHPDALHSWGGPASTANRTRTRRSASWLVIVHSTRFEGMFRTDIRFHRRADMLLRGPRTYFGTGKAGEALSDGRRRDSVPLPLTLEEWAAKPPCQQSRDVERGAVQQSRRRRSHAQTSIS